MKKIIYSAILLLLALGCAKKEDSFVIKGDPYFSITVRDDSSVPVAELDPMSARYTLNMDAEAYSQSASKSDHVAKALRFNVKSNLRWKIVPVSGETEDWIHPFPASGEKDGIFFFKTKRNISSTESREILYNVLVDLGSGEFEPLEGVITVNQARSAEFLELSAAKFNVEASGQTLRLRVLSNVDWTYSLSTMEEYATPDLSWIEDQSAHVASKQVDTLVLKVGSNPSGIRGANINVRYTIGGETMEEIVSITQYPAVEATLEGFPVKWAVRIPDNTFASSFPTDGTILPVSGKGLATYHNEAGKAADTGGKTKLDVSDNSPRVTGAWPGDYMEFVAASPVSAGTIAKIVFATRSSAQGQKYWRLEYRDGQTWKIAGASFTDESVMAPDGKPVVYTHAMNADGATNTLVESTAIFSENTDQVEFRFICAANWRASGEAPPAAPGTATWRLSVDEISAEDPYQPQISIVSAGTEILTPANFTINPEYLVFEGSGGSKKFTASCDQDFTLEPSADWITVSTQSSDAGEDISFTVTCAKNTVTKMREGTVLLKAGITRKEIAIIQAAGVEEGGTPQELDPLISIVGGNSTEVGYDAGTSVVKVQANVEVSAKSDASWLTVSRVPSSKGAVEALEYAMSYSANPSTSESRTATVRFYNTVENLEAYLTVTQGKNISARKTYFEDDFEWLAPFVAAYKAAVPADADKLDPVGSNLSTHAQPNIWSKFSDSIGAAVIEHGYEDLNKSANTLYMQENYFKMGKGDKQTGLRLPQMEFEGSTPVDVEITFNWCAHMAGSGAIDNVPLVVVISGPGVMADNGTQTSNPLVTGQSAGVLAWQNASVKINGVTSATRIEIKPNFDNFAVAGNHRWHLDNILITDR